MQKFFVVSLCLMFSCYGAQPNYGPNCPESGSFKELLQARKSIQAKKNASQKKEVQQQALLKRPAPQRASLTSRSTHNLLSGLTPEEIAAMKARADAQEETKEPKLPLIKRTSSRKTAFTEPKERDYPSSFSLPATAPTKKTTPSSDPFDNDEDSD